MQRVASAVLVLAFATAAAAQQADAPLSPFQRQKAETLLRTQLACLGCHELNGDGGRVAPSLSDVGKRRSSRYTRAMVADPRPVLPGAAMPQPVMAASARDLIVRFLSAGATGADLPVMPTPEAGSTLPQAAPNGAALYGKWCAAAREGAQDFALRSRWATILGFAGDRFTEAGDLAAARLAYDRALEAMPDHPRLLQNRGNAARAGGDVAVAIASYERALAREPRNALTLVNLGIARQMAGDSLRAADEFRRAADLDPGEPLAWFNLGNVTLIRGDLPGAAGHFRRALALDGSLVEAHFQLARIALLMRDTRAASLAVRQGLALDSSNVVARNLLCQLNQVRKP